MKGVCSDPKESSFAALYLSFKFCSECQLIAHNFWFLITLLTLITSFSAEVGSCFRVKKADKQVMLADKVADEQSRTFRGEEFHQQRDKISLRCSVTIGGNITFCISVFLCAKES